MKTKILMILLVILSVHLFGQYNPKPDNHRLVTLEIINKNLYPIIDSILNYKTKAEDLKPGTFFTIEFGTYLVPDLIDIEANGPSLYGCEAKFIGVFNYKDRTFIVSADSLDKTIFRKNKQFRKIDFSFKPVVGHLRNGTPVYNRRTFGDVWCRWVCRYIDFKFKMLAFYSCDKNDPLFDNIENEYHYYPAILSTYE